MRACIGLYVCRYVFGTLPFVRGLVKLYPLHTAHGKKGHQYRGICCIHTCTLLRGAKRRARHVSFSRPILSGNVTKMTCALVRACANMQSYCGMQTCNGEAKLATAKLLLACPPQSLRLCLHSCLRDKGMPANSRMAR